MDRMDISDKRESAQTSVTSGAIVPVEVGRDRAGDVGASAAKNPGRVLRGLADLPSGTLLDEPALAAALDVSQRTVRAMAARGEIPPGIRLGGRTTWLAGRVLAHIGRCAEEAAREAEKRNRS